MDRNKKYNLLIGFPLLVLVLFFVGEGRFCKAAMQVDANVAAASLGVLDAESKVVDKKREMETKYGNGSAAGETQEEEKQKDIKALEKLEAQANAAHEALEQANHRADVIRSADPTQGAGRSLSPESMEASNPFPSESSKPSTTAPASENKPAANSEIVPANEIAGAGDQSQALMAAETGTTLPTPKIAEPTPGEQLRTYNDNFIGPTERSSFTDQNGNKYDFVNKISDGDTPGTEARYYSNDGGQTGYRVSGNGDVHHMERMANGEYLLGTVQNGTAAIGQVVPRNGFNEFHARTDTGGNISRESFINSSPTSRMYGQQVLERLPAADIIQAARPTRAFTAEDFDFSSIAKPTGCRPGMPCWKGN